MSRSALSREALFLCALASAFGAQAANATSPWPSITSVTPSPIESGSAVAAKPGAEAPSCARKVKVVYAGYGEAERAGCPATVSAKTAEH